MKRRNYLQLLAWLMAGFSLAFISCGNDKDELADGGEKANSEETPVAMPQVSDLTAEKTLKENELQLTWTNPQEAVSVEISYRMKDGDGKSDGSLQIRTYGKQTSSHLLTVSAYGTYEISAVAIGNYGERSEAVTITATPCSEEEAVNIVFLERADILMSSLMELCFGKSDRDCWNNAYPNATGPYWDGDAVVWGQGAGLSGYVALRKASLGVRGYEDKYTALTNRMFNSINRFITTDDNKQAYAVYPQNGNDRFFDDNVWIGLDMAELYAQTQETRFLEKAVMVWDYLMTGNDDACGGGIRWQERPKLSDTKNTCSTAPTAVLGCKLYQLTREQKYLDKAIELYQWLRKYMVDPSDHLYYDNIKTDMTIDKRKYCYNSGQPILAGCLLYKITGDGQYLTDARQTAASAYEKWFSPFESPVLKEEIRIINGDHTWFYAVLFRGLVELYTIAPDTKEYITAYEKTMSHAWLSNLRNPVTNLISSRNFMSDEPQSSWEILHEGACVEILAQLAALERDGLLNE